MKKITLSLLAAICFLATFAQHDSLKHKERKSAGKHHHEKMMKPEGQKPLPASLNLTNEQQEKIKSINIAFKADMKALQDSEEKGSPEMKTKRQALAMDHQAKINAVLTPEQRQQAASLKSKHKRQSKDAGNHRVEKMEKSLDLTATQTASIQKINASFKTRMDAIRNNNNLGEAEKNELLNTLKMKQREEISGLLTAEQKLKMKEHKGRSESRSPVK